MKTWFILARDLVLAQLFLMVCVLPALAADSWQDAQEAARRGDIESAVRIATQLIKNGRQDPEIYYRRGRWNFRLGHMQQSMGDFDKFIALRPGTQTRLWERGITCYYVGDFEAGADQFVKYQTYYSNDVENAVWRYLCQARFDGRRKAREAILPIEFDRRVPMMEIYKLFRGEGNVEAVLKRLDASNAGTTQSREERFNAHLYIGLFYDSEGDPSKAKQHIDEAVKQYESGHYMWAVAKQHQILLQRRASKDGDASLEKAE